MVVVVYALLCYIPILEFTLHVNHCEIILKIVTIIPVIRKFCLYLRSKSVSSGLDINY
jgi:hypothetical protein